MTLALIVSVLATGVGWLLGGRVNGLMQVRLHRCRLLVTAATTALVGDLASLVWSPALVVGFVIASVLVAYFAWLNRSVPGLFLVGVGCGLNAVVMAVNVGMPVSLHAARWAGARLSEPVLAASPWREAAADDTILPFLGQIVPLAWPVSPQVASVGDVLIAAGCGLLVVAGMTAHRPQDSAERGTMNAMEVAPAAAETEAHLVS
jgi:Family of unknown function (DUF5317)